MRASLSDCVRITSPTMSGRASGGCGYARLWRRQGAWWAPRSSSPVCGREIAGGFDSRPPPLPGTLALTRLDSMAHETSTGLLDRWRWVISSKVRAIPERSGGLLNRGPIAFVDEIQGPATVQHEGRLVARCQGFSRSIGAGRACEVRWSGAGRSIRHSTVHLPDPRSRRRGSSPHQGGWALTRCASGLHPSAPPT
jgi:hypothetical protein